MIVGDGQYFWFGLFSTFLVQLVTDKGVVVLAPFDGFKTGLFGCRMAMLHG